MNREEYIICAANYYNDGKKHTFNPKNIDIGFVVCGHRHHNCIQTFAQIVGFPYNQKAIEIMNTEIQGFLTNTNKFVDRQQALIIAENANQLIEGEPIAADGLHSENIY